MSDEKRPPARPGGMGHGPGRFGGEKAKDFGGTITARNRDEGGAAFEIRLPATRRGESPSPAQQSPAPQAPAAPAAQQQG